MLTMEAKPGQALALTEMTDALDAFLTRRAPRKLLLLPPDITRIHSRAGALAAHIYRTWHARATVHILPALGSHQPMSAVECARMFGPDIPAQAFLTHNWRTDCVQLGEVPASFVSEVSGGRIDAPIAVQVNRLLVEGGYDLVLSLGQVVPHEVVGMANYSKNILVGVGGIAMIHSTHFLGAVCGMEAAMGEDHAPVRRVFDYAHEHFLAALPLHFVYTVVAPRGGRDEPVAFAMGAQRDAFTWAVGVSQRENITMLPRAPRTVVCWMDPEEFRSTWVAGKAIYRTRMAVADGGRIIVLAPGVHMMGEDAGMDTLLRRYGYAGTERILALVQTEPELRANLSAAAHLIHGSSDGRFQIYCAAPKLGREVVERQVGYAYMPWDEAMRLYDPAHLTPGWNTVAGEEIYFVPNPALGLWKADRGA